VVAVRYTVTQPARVVTRVLAGARKPRSGSIRPCERPGEHSLARPVGERRSVPAGDYNIVVEATVGQNNFSTSQPIRVTHGAVDTLPHLTSLPGYTICRRPKCHPRAGAGQTGEVRQGIDAPCVTRIGCDVEKLFCPTVASTTML